MKKTFILKFENKTEALKKDQLKSLKGGDTRIAYGDSNGLGNDPQLENRP